MNSCHETPMIEVTLFGTPDELNLTPEFDRMKTTLVTSPTTTTEITS